MSDRSNHESREARYGKTERKHLTLAREAVDMVQAYAERHGLYFSVAVETLALIGLGNTTAESLPRLVSNLLERTLNRQFNRFAKLISLAALSAEEANYKTDVLLLQTIWREARLAPDTFADSLLVSTAPDVQPDAQARQMREQRRDGARQSAVARLKKPRRDSSPLWHMEAADKTNEA